MATSRLKAQVLVLGIIGFIMTPIRWTASGVVHVSQFTETKALQVWQWCDNKRIRREHKKEFNLRFKFKTLKDGGQQDVQ